MKQFSFFVIMILLSITGLAQQGQVEDAMFDKYGKEHLQKGEGWLKNAMGAKVEPEYKFPLMVDMHITSYKKGEKKDETDVTYFINGAAGRFALRTPDERKKKKERMLIIYDHKANAMITLNETDKTGVAMNLNAFMSGEAIRKRNESSDRDNRNTDCKKSGRKKDIQGYNCEEYVCEDESSRSEIWITSGISFDLSSVSGRNAWSGYFARTKGLGGMMMEGLFYKNGTLESKVEVTRVNPEENMIVNTTDYNFLMR